jgi:hypothetical protein
VAYYTEKEKREQNGAGLGIMMLLMLLLIMFVNVPGMLLIAVIRDISKSTFDLGQLFLSIIRIMTESWPKTFTRYIVTCSVIVIALIVCNYGIKTTFTSRYLGFYFLSKNVEAERFNVAGSHEPSSIAAPSLDAPYLATNNVNRDVTFSKQPENINDNLSSSESVPSVILPSDAHGAVTNNDANPNLITYEQPVLSNNNFSSDQKPSFDCKRARSTGEKLICNDPDLSKLDNELALIHRLAKSQTSDVQDFKKQTENAWKWRESNCYDKECLVKWYSDRIYVLKNGL